jgi:secreted protein with Ig-like and vWFA domain
LLTDGAVGNDSEIIELVKKNCLPTNRVRLHTFGLGQGASENLIKGCAFAGIGNFSFIYKAEEIEEKVIQAVSKSKLEYLLVTKFQILDESDDVLHDY